MLRIAAGVERDARDGSMKVSRERGQAKRIQQPAAEAAEAQEGERSRRKKVRTSAASTAYQERKAYRRQSSGSEKQPAA